MNAKEHTLPLLLPLLLPLPLPLELIFGENLEEANDSIAVEMCYLQDFFVYYKKKKKNLS